MGLVRENVPGLGLRSRFRTVGVVLGTSKFLVFAFFG